MLTATTTPTDLNTFIPTISPTPNATLTYTPSSTNTLRPTTTSTVTHTPVPQEAILYYEDFEDGNADGFIAETWNNDRFHVIDDGHGNKVWEGLAHPEVYLNYVKLDRSANYGISLRFYSPEGFGAFGLAFRRDPNSSCKRYELHINPQWYQMQQRYDNDCRTTSISDGYSLSIQKRLQKNQWYEVTIEIQDTSFRWRIDDGKTYEGSSTAYLSGTFGIDVFGVTSPIWFDDIRIWALK